ncbi:GNAT family N-acetyltransferase [Microbacterium paludicola]|nr:GNAT family N-acetyltransferase [Microbacterium paludicola]
MGYMSFVIREPAAEEAALLAELHVATWQEAYAHLLPAGFFDAEHVTSRHRMWNQILNDPAPTVTVRVAEHGAQLAGFALAGPSSADGGEKPGRDTHLYAIYVSAAHHGTGVGQALLDSALGTAPATLWVAKQNPRAIAFYLRNGFAFDGMEKVDPMAPAITEARMVR